MTNPSDSMSGEETSWQSWDDRIPCLPLQKCYNDNKVIQKYLSFRWSCFKQNHPDQRHARKAHCTIFRTKLLYLESGPLIGIRMRRKAKMTKAILMIRFELWPGVTAPHREAFCPTCSRRSWTKSRRIITLRSSSSSPSGSSHPVMSVVLWKSDSPPLAWCCLSSCPNRVCHSTTKFLSCWTIVNDEKYEYY